MLCSRRVFQPACPTPPGRRATPRAPSLIYFRGGAAGRRPALVGTRLDAWQVVETVRANSGDTSAAADFLAVSERQVSASLDYYADLKPEVDAWAHRQREIAAVEQEAFRRRQAAPRVRLLLDEHFAPLIAEVLRERGHDAVAEMPSLRGESDERLLSTPARSTRAGGRRPAQPLHRRPAACEERRARAQDRGLHADWPPGDALSRGPSPPRGAPQAHPDGAASCGPTSPQATSRPSTRPSPRTRPR